jgi:pre-mRNA-processing factor 40
MQTDRRTSSVDTHSMRLIFERLREKVLRRSDEDRHHQRRAVDALRSKIKHLDPPVMLTDTWDLVRPRIEKSEEYKTVETDEARKGAFDKVLRRVKEREDERERERSRRDRDRREPRDSRSLRGDSHRPARHRSRTPETDPYEADRKKAQADREKRSRRPGSFGLSPPPRDREHRERDRGDRYEGRGHKSTASTSSHYERERREREAERERQYLSRADPRDLGSSELDYGDSKPTGTRRRREGSEEGRESKVSFVTLNL